MQFGYLEFHPRLRWIWLGKAQQVNAERKPCPLCGKVEEPDQLHAVYRCEGAMQQLADLFKRK